ncbi:flavin-containing monooxygenase [Sporosarcina sp. FSL W7-1283]|uniref:flavin-containing monooxygenase n=1 Tax=Sporosarcina sp. FSL W7-1283 TaxID=2921560 RepID=UPI0030F6A154
MERYDVIIVGAGQAGIAMGYYLKQEGLSFLLIDSKERIGDTWRQRYDSLVLFTTRKYSSLPEMQMDGPPEGFPTKDEIADYLEQYVSRYDLPVHLNTKVTTIKKERGVFYIETSRGILEAKQVVIASGAFQKPFVPQVAVNKTGGPFQIHSSLYRSPKQLLKGSVLVVGGGNSGAQIAVELAHENPVTLAVSRPFKFLPLHFLGKSIFYWLDLIGLLHAGINTKRGKWFSKQHDPIFGSELKALMKEGRVCVKPRVVKVEGNEVSFEDHSVQNFENIIWSTGFIPFYDWIQIDGAISENRKPVHKRGISPIRGLYFIGLPWQHQRGSALICGVSQDAKYLVSHIAEFVKENTL